MSTSIDSPFGAQRRTIRVFVSSTFLDMQAERDELVKRVFPQLRELCEARGVVWGEVDLRWGITDQQTAEGQTLPICFREIRECRPCFLGMLGDHYGWVPQAIDAALLEQEPWLAGHGGKSVTELEIEHGVLADPEAAEHAFFYLRDPGYAHRDPPLEAAHDARLEALKARIRSSRRPVRENYPDPQQLGNLVLADLTGVIDHLFPAGSEPGPIERERAMHEAFALGRAAVYVANTDYFDQLDAHAAGDGEPLVVLGESGAGKSALLANWALRLAARSDSGSPTSDQGAPLMLMHFVGASPASADWAAMTRRIIGELNGGFELGLELPDDDAALWDAFADALHRAAARGRVVLVIDALNQLDDEAGAPDLVWLPPAIPRNIRLVLSTLPGRPLDELSRRGWPTLHVSPLSADERGELIHDYLFPYGKTLAGQYAGRIAAAAQAANPLFLRTLLEELRLYGEHQTLERRLDELLGAPDIPRLYELILIRWEKDYERDAPGLVGRAMVALWAARRGLGEHELLEVLGMGSEPLPHALWSPIYLAAKQALVNRDGLLAFAHDYVRAAIEHRYLGDDGKLDAHMFLAAYFDKQPALGARTLDELPWQLARAQAWQTLYQLLADQRFLRALYANSPWELRRYWAEIQAGSSLRMTDAYRALIEAPDSDATAASIVGSLLQDTGDTEAAIALLERLAHTYRKSAQEALLADALVNLSGVLPNAGDSEGALAASAEAGRIFERLGNETGIARVLEDQGAVAHHLGQWDRARTLYQQAEQICRRLNDRDGIQHALGSRALVERNQGHPDVALGLLREQERICRELGHLGGVGDSLNVQGMIFAGWGELDQAMMLYLEQERICRDLGDRGGLAESLGNQGGIHQQRGDLNDALVLFREQEELARDIHRPHSLVRALGNEGVILLALQDLDGALTVHAEEERISREIGDLDQLQRSLGNQALVYTKREGELERALSLFEEKERICRQLGQLQGLANALGNQALIWQSRGESDRALALHAEEEQIYRRLHSPLGVAFSLGNQAGVFAKRRDWDRALSLYAEAERISRELGDRDGVAYALNRQADVHLQQDGGRAAERLAREALALATQAGLPERFQEASEALARARRNVN